MTTFPRPGLLRSRPWLLPLALCACSAMNTQADFATNSRLYADVPFRTAAPGDRTVFVAPVRDARGGGAPLPTHEAGCPIRYGTDEVWERPVVQMLGEVLQRQFADSELFPAVLDHAEPTALVVVPTLLAFTTGAMETIGGSSSFAEVALRLEVLGPASADGARPLWLDRTFRNRQVSELSMNPVSPYRLVGRSLQLAVGQALTGLDGSNIARSSVPVEVVLPSDEAAVPAAPAAEAAAVRR